MSQAVVIADSPNLAAVEASDAHRAPSYLLPGSDPEARGRDIVKYTLAQAHSLKKRMQGTS
jgi:hypothetical protein